MRNIQPDMNVAKQRRKLTQLAADAPESHRSYINHLVSLFDAKVAADMPTPASTFIPMYQEEFGEK